MPSLYLLLLPIILLPLYLLLITLHTRLHNHLTATRLNTSPPPRTPHDGSFGICTLLASIRATRKERGPIHMHQSLNAIKLPNGSQAHTVRAPIFDYTLLITRDPENCKALFGTQSGDFDIGKHRERTFKGLLGDGVMTTRGERWRHSRALVRGQFARWNVGDLGVLRGHVDALIRVVRGGVSGSGEWTRKVDLGPLLQALTLDTGTEFLFGVSTSVLDPSQRREVVKGEEGPDFDGFGGHLDKAKELLDRRGALAKYGWLYRDNEYPRHVKAVQEFVDYFVRLRLAGEKDEEKGERFVLLDQLVKETRDPLELRSEVLNVLHASRDTTAALTAWVFYFLARREDVWSRLRLEVVRMFGVKGENEPGKEVIFDRLMSLPYLQWVINETIRFIGIVPMNERMALRDTTLPRGGGADGMSPIFVPKGQQVLIPTYSMQHREDIWGPDVEEYKPERWENRKFGWDFMPFGNGPRQCLGQQFARLEACYVLVRFMQTFDKVENVEEGDGQLRMHHTIENRSGNGVQVRLRIAQKTTDV